MTEHLPASPLSLTLVLGLILLACTHLPSNPPLVVIGDLLAEAEAYAEEGRYTAAEARYQRALDSAPTDARAALALADLYQAWRRPTDGLAALDTARRRGALEGELEARRLQLLTDARAWDEVAETAEELLAHTPASPTALVALLTAHLERGACGDAAAIARQAVERGIEQPEVITTASLLEGEPTLLAEVIPALRIDPTACDPTCDRTLGLRLVREGRWALAACLLERATATAPDDAEALAWYGETLARTGRPQAAYTPLRRSVDLAPELPQAWLLLGTLTLSTGDLAQARVALLNAQRLDPTSPAPCLAVAELKAQAGRYDEIDRWTEAALDRAPDDVAIAKAIVRFYLGRGLADNAVSRRSAEIALQLAPDDAEALTLLGRQKLTDGQPDTALTLLDRAVAIDPARAEAHYWRAQALLALGSSPEAQLAFTRAADLGGSSR